MSFIFHQGRHASNSSMAISSSPGFSPFFCHQRWSKMGHTKKGWNKPSTSLKLPRLFLRKNMCNKTSNGFESVQFSWHDPPNSSFSGCRCPPHLSALPRNSSSVQRRPHQRRRRCHRLGRTSGFDGSTWLEFGNMELQSQTKLNFLHILEMFGLKKELRTTSVKKCASHSRGTRCNSAVQIMVAASCPEIVVLLRCSETSLLWSWSWSFATSRTLGISKIADWWAKAETLWICFRSPNLYFDLFFRFFSKSNLQYFWIIHLKTRWNIKIHKTCLKTLKPPI